MQSRVKNGYRISGTARTGFRVFGRNLLKDAGIVVVKLEATTARDTLLTYDYERRIASMCICEWWM
ncbi:phage neck terminator protein [Paenibacillus melissococcoides]|uniref:phage neck terminator protein n=1 Tax=Paenibacillus melissococcoides TaxID=2912268 RepID=UPI0036F25B08